MAMDLAVVVILGLLAIVLAAKVTTAIVPALWGCDSDGWLDCVRNDADDADDDEDLTVTGEETIR